ncbi:odorant-binding protein-like [Diceros bicornis minor]|uniref:odorant-binding protein-like n=1 Tax=Diceros bicornis minor TaxID=77932 RepID=UPI0026E9F410|nr:odorant-binding protein-like [Diceros bicornis minor]
MKILPLSLVLGLVCAAQSTRIPALVSGEWKSIYMASSDRAKMSDNAPFKAFLRRIDFENAYNKITFKFFVVVNGQCIEKTSVARKIAENVYTSDYAGKVEFHILHASDHALVGSLTNVDTNGKVTHITTLLGKGYYVEWNDIEKFKKATREKGIPEDNIVNLLTVDHCPSR